MPRKSISGEDFEAELAHDPVYQEGLKQFAARQERRLEEDRKAIGPLLADLASVLPAIATPWDLANANFVYPDAIPVLLEHLTRPYPPNERIGLARALGKPWARKQVWDALVAAYRAEPNDNPSGGENFVKDALADTIAQLSTNKDEQVLIDLLTDTTNGRSRVLLVRALARMRSVRANEVLKVLASDPALANEVSDRLRQKARRRVGPRTVTRPN